MLVVEIVADRIDDVGSVQAHDRVADVRHGDDNVRKGDAFSLRCGLCSGGMGDVVDPAKTTGRGMESGLFHGTGGETIGFENHAVHGEHEESGESRHENQ